MSTKDPERQVVLAYSIWPTGHHRSAWRLSEAFNRGTTDVDFLASTVRTAERGLFDYYFVGNAIKSDPASAGPNGNEVFKAEGFTLASYAAAITSRLGLVVTINSTYDDPFTIARQVVSLDHLSKGRAGLNIITGARNSTAFSNFSRTRHATVDEKYDRATEFVQILHGLSDSWEESWLVDDKAAGVFLDPSKGHYLDHDGSVFQVKGPLNVPRPPQGHIPLIHAGTSERSFEFGARFADIRFSPYRGQEWNSRYYAKTKARLADHGRAERDQLIVPGIVFYTADTRAEARSRYREIQALTLEEFAPKILEDLIGLDLSNAKPTDRVVDVLPVEALRQRHRTEDFELSATGDAWNPAAYVGEKGWIVQQALESFGDDEAVTLADLHHYVANFPGNQAPFVGSHREAADWIEENFHARAFDGVKLFPPYARGPFENFVDYVVPELQRKGIFRTEYTTSTLRGHLGLAQPENSFTAR